METVHKWLHDVRFKNSALWNAQYFLSDEGMFNKKYEMNRIGFFLKRNKTQIRILDNVEYKRVTIKTNNGGCYLRDVVIGKTIGTKIQNVISKGDFIISKIDARNGAFGIVPDSLDKAIVTNDFPVFDINTEIIIPRFLLLITSTERFKTFVQKCSNGTTNRQRVDIDDFFNIKVPTPELTKQQKIIDTYNDKIKLAEEKENKYALLENYIITYIDAQLGIAPQGSTIPFSPKRMACEPAIEFVADYQPMETSANTYVWGQETKNAYKYLKMVRYKKLKTWDYNNGQQPFYEILDNSYYRVEELGNIYKFVNRSWKKDTETFRYIELGSVDPSNGVTKAEKLQTHKAPSRATQIVKKGDLIIGTTRPYLKKFAIVDSDFDNCVASSGFQVISPDANYNLNFLCEYLKTPTAISQFELFMAGALYPAINSADLKKIRVPLPPLDIQNEIAKHISELRNQIQKLKQEAITLRETALKEFENEIFE